MSCANWYIKRILVTRYIAFKLIGTSCRFPNLFRFILIYFFSIFVAGLFWLPMQLCFRLWKIIWYPQKVKKKRKKRKKENITTVLEKLLTIAKLSILFI